MNFWKWLAGFWSDGSGEGSRKAAAGYWGLITLSYMIFKDVNGAQVDKDMFWQVLTFTGGMFALILGERFVSKKPSNPSNPDSPSQS